MFFLGRELTICICIEYLEPVFLFIVNFVVELLPNFADRLILCKTTNMVFWKVLSHCRHEDCENCKGQVSKLWWGIKLFSFFVPNTFYVLFKILQVPLIQMEEWGNFWPCLCDLVPVIRQVHRSVCWFSPQSHHCEGRVCDCQLWSENLFCLGLHRPLWYIYLYYKHDLWPACYYLCKTTCSCPFIGLPRLYLPFSDGF